MIGPALKSVLAARRVEYNARFAAARQQMRALDAAAFGAYLHDTVDPVISAAAASNADAAGIADALYDLGLTLVAQGWLGPAARQPALATAWRDWLLALGSRLAEAPARLAGSGWNALLQMNAVPGVSLTSWVAAVRRGVEHCSSGDALLDLGRVAAWHAGAAHQRSAALAAALRLPPLALSAALDLRQPLPREVWHGLARLPASVPADWVAGDRIELSPLGWIGGFSGYGGPFRRRPHLHRFHERILVQEGERNWVLHADGYGATLLPAPPGNAPEAPPLPPDVQVAPGRIRVDGHTLTDSELVDPASAVVAQGVLAVALGHSFRIGLYRLPAALERQP